jgi:hypothetical protein
MHKRDEEFSITMHKQFDISQLKNLVENFDSEWQINTSRQRSEYTHRYTESYFIYSHPLNWKLNTPYKIQQICFDSNVMSLINPIVKELEDFHNGKVGQCLLIKLKGEKDIHPHNDSGDYLMNSRRHHVPIITNQNVFFTVDNKTVTMKEGECWEINNAKIHSVVNQSDLDRVHLLIDIIPNRFIS